MPYLFVADMKTSSTSSTHSVTGWCESRCGWKETVELTDSDTLVHNFNYSFSSLADVGKLDDGYGGGKYWSKSYGYCVEIGILIMGTQAKRINDLP